VTPEDRQKLREAAVVAVNATPPRTSVERVLGRWSLQTSNSFRRIGCHGDGDVLCGTKHPHDGHPDLLARPGVLDYIVAAQPRVVIEMLDDVDDLEDKLRKAEIICSSIADVEERLSQMSTTFVALQDAIKQCMEATDAESFAKARSILDQLITSLGPVRS
jgi:hypothetical protein